MTARLIRPDGTVKREWQRSRPVRALTVDRNYPAGWRVEIRDNNGGLSSPIIPI